MFNGSAASRRLPSVAAALAAAAIAMTACSTPPASTTPAPAGQSQTQPAAEPAGEAGPEGLKLFPGTAKTNDAEQGTGDWAVGDDGTPNTAKSESATRWVQLTASSAGDLDPVVVNGAGLTLYRFDNDDANPSKSNCAGQCAVTWPPVLVKPGGKIFLAGVRKAEVGVVQRDDGTLQVTVGGWPVYRFAQDTKPGDTKGQGVGGTWFGVTPDGGKAGSPPATETAPPEQPDADAPLTARIAVLFDEPRFSDNGGAQGVSGTGCKNVSRRGVTSSLSLIGTAKLWSEPDCEGESVVVDGDVAVLASIDFDDKVASIRFAD